MCQLMATCFKTSEGFGAVWQVRQTAQSKSPVPALVHETVSPSSAAHGEAADTE